MKIPQDVCECGNVQNVQKGKALGVGMAERAKGFIEKGSEIYQGSKPEGADEHH